MKTKLFIPLLFALITLGMHKVSYAEPQTLTATIEFPAIDVLEDAGAKVKTATLKFQNKSYPITFDGLSVGGAKGVQVTLSADVYNLNTLNELPNNYVNELTQDNSNLASSDSLWLYSNKGISINLHTNNPQLSLASGGESVSIMFGSAP